MIKKGFTLIETLIVLMIVCCLMLLSFHYSKKFSLPSGMFLYQLETLIETARFEAIETKETVTLNFEKDRICLNSECYFENIDLNIENPQRVTFNAEGRIHRGTHLDLQIHQRAYRLIFNVGEGAFHIEENSFCFAGCIIWFGNMFMRFNHFICLPYRTFKKHTSKRGQSHGKNCQLAGKRGFTLIEALFALWINALIMLLLSSILIYLSKALLISNHHDIAYAIIQLTEDVNTSLEVRTDNSTMTLVYAKKEMTYFLDNGRLVKTPGFDIYLHNIDDLMFQNEGEYMYIYLKRGDHTERFQIGTFFRPSQERVCQSVCTGDTELPDVAGDEPFTDD